MTIRIPFIVMPSPILLFIFLFLSLSPSAQALRFEIASTQGQGTIRCFEQYVTRDTLVKGSIDVPSKPFQILDFVISDDSPTENRHYSKLNAFGPQKFSFTSNVDANIKYCFTATLESGQTPSSSMKREAFLHVETGISSPSEATDLSPDTKSRFAAMESELAWLRTVSQESVQQMLSYDKADQDMDRINEGTKERVFNTSGLSLLLLVALGAWEIWYLYGFFKSKHLI